MASTRNEGMVLELVENPDIIASVGHRTPKPLVVGFAAETERTIEHARGKLQRKGLDMIVVNDVSQPGIGFSTDENAATILTANSERAIAQRSKRALADSVIEEVARLLQARA